MPKVSVGLPVYNGEQFIERAIRSVLEQTDTDLELVVSDNASTDRTVEIVEQLAADDARVRLIRNDSNRGAAWNYNHVFERSCGEYFRWQAHDDWVEPTLHERLVHALAVDPDVVLAHSWTTFVDDDGSELRRFEDDLGATAERSHERLGHVIRRLTYCNPIFGLVRRDVLAETALIGPFPGSDVPLLYELAVRGRFAVVPEFLTHRRPGNSLKANPTKRQLTEWFDPTASAPRRAGVNTWRASVSAIARSDDSWIERGHTLATFHVVWPVEYARRVRRRGRRRTSR